MSSTITEFATGGPAGDVVVVVRLVMLSQSATAGAETRSPAPRAFAASLLRPRAKARANRAAMAPRGRDPGLQESNPVEGKVKGTTENVITLEVTEIQEVSTNTNTCW